MQCKIIQIVWGLGMETRERLNGKTNTEKNALCSSLNATDFAIISKEKVY